MAAFLKISILLFCSSLSFGQIQGDIQWYIGDKMDHFPSDTAYFQVPNTSDFEIWTDAMDYIFQDKLDDANNQLLSLNYHVIEFQDTISEKKYLVIEELSPNKKYWGTYILNLQSCRKLVIQCPHPIHDSKTGVQGIFCFQKLNNFAYFVSGIHRCYGSDYSNCSGTTKACSSESAAFKNSDNAHSVASIFQKMTEILNNRDEHLYFIQLHGFGKKDSDPYMILSNGTKLTPESDILPRFRDNLMAQDTLLTSKIAHLDDWNHLIGRTNVQGRLINGEDQPCENQATTVSGRFIHFEQERTLLRKDSIGWNKVFWALNQTFECKPVENLDLENNKFQVFPNPNTGIFQIEHAYSQIQIYDHLGRCVHFEKQGNQIRLESKGIFFIRILDENDVFESKIVIY